MLRLYFFTKAKSSELLGGAVSRLEEIDIALCLAPLRDWPLAKVGRLELGDHRLPFRSSIQHPPND